MSRYEGVDFYNIEKHLTEEEIMVRDLVRDWVDEKVIPIIEDYYTKGTFPMELISEIGEMGLFGCNLEGYECAGLSHVAYGLVCQELERCDSGIRSFVSVQGSLVMFPIFAYGSEEQKKKWLPKLASAEWIGAWGLTEHNTGSDAGAMATTAVKEGDNWVINGTKNFITHAISGDIAVVMARTGEKGDSHGISTFVIE